MTGPPCWVAAVDLGASSVRVCICDIAESPLTYEVVHRVSHRPQADSDGVLRWDWPEIRKAVHDGLDRVLESGPLASIGIDTWGVDYGLVDRSGELLADPVCYRDDRTAGYRRLFERIDERRLWEINGLQCLPFNTIFQLDAEEPDLLARTAHVLTLPELLVLDLTGEVCAEATSAGTTGLVDQTTRTWSEELLEAVGVNRAALPEIQQPGTRVGDWRDVPVHLVAGHDTASAVVAIAAEEATPTFVCSGTWLLTGQELAAPLLGEEARQSGFTNEYGPEAKTRFLKNVAGFWILEECRRAWGGPSVSELLDEASHARIPPATFDATDPRFLAPTDMEAAVRAAGSLHVDAPRADVVALIVNSLARTTADVIDLAGRTSGRSAESVHLVGGGVRATVFVDRLEHHLDVPVHLGEPESSALGNAMIQGVALGRWSDVASARKALTS